MGQHIKKGIKELLLEANKVANRIDTVKAISYLNNQNYLFIDIRDYREIKREGKIPGSFSCPRGMLEFWIDPESPYHKSLFNEDKIFIFYCASAWRSALAAKTAMEMGLNPVYHLHGGFNEWIKQGGPIEQK